MLDKIIEALVKAGVIKDEQKTAVNDALKDVQLQPEVKVDASKMTDPQLRELVSGLTQQINNITQANKQLTDALAAEKTARDNAIKAQADADLAAKKTNAEKLVADALKNGKIAEAEKQTYLDKATADYEGTKTAIERFTTIPGFKPATKDDDKGGEKKVDVKFLGPLAGADPVKMEAMKKMESVQ